MNRNQISPTTLHSNVKELSQIQLLPGQIYAGEGELPLAEMPRVLDELQLEPGQVQGLSVHWSAKTWMDDSPGAEPEYRLRIGLRGLLPLQCQKCLGFYEEPFEFEAQFLILQTWEAVEDYPLDDEEEDVLAQDSKFNLFELLEGEVLLSIPLMPEHPPGKCQKNLKSDVKSHQKAAKDNKKSDDKQENKLDDHEAEKKPNPFAVLKNLKLDK